MGKIGEVSPFVADRKSANYDERVDTLFSQERGTMPNRPRRSPSAPLAIERLEDRLPLAGNITAVVSGSTLKITGDAEANVLRVQSVGGDATKFTLSSTSGTINNGGDFTTPTGVKNISLKMLAGDDEVTFRNPDGPIIVPVVVQGNITINGGDGTNHVLAVGLTVQKNLKITNGSNATSADETLLADLDVGGSLAVKNGNGNSITHILHSREAGQSRIARNVTITNGIGQDTNLLVDTNVGGNVTVKSGNGDANGIAGGTQIFNRENTTTRSVIGGNVSITYKDGRVNESFIVADVIADAEVLGNVTFIHGPGEFATAFDGNIVNQPTLIHGNLTLKGTGPNTVALGGGFKRAGLSVGKNLTLTTGAAADAVTLNKLVVAGKATFKLGDGANSVEIISGGASTVQKSFSITGGRDTDEFDFNALLNTPKLTINLKDGVNSLSADLPNIDKATVNGGNGVDTLTVNGGAIDSLFVKLFGDNDVVTATNLDISTSVNLDGGLGVDVLTQIGGSLPADPAKIKIKGFP